MASPQHQIAIIGGGGMVGAATAYACMVKNIAAKIHVVDIVEKAAEGQALDVADASRTVQGSAIKSDYKQAGQCDLIIITAGYPQKPGEPRSALLGKNKQIFHDIFESMKPLNPKAKVLVVANPVDVLTHIAQKASGLPKNQVFGSGTYLDSCRLAGELADKLKVHSSDINVYVLGEHGDNQFVGWSAARVGGMPLIEEASMKGQNLEEVSTTVMRKAYTIIDAKRSTYFGIGMCAAVIAEACLNNQNKVFPLVNFVEQHGVYMSWPCTLGINGTGKHFDVPLNGEEMKKLKVAVDAIKEGVAEADAQA